MFRRHPNTGWGRLKMLEEEEVETIKGGGQRTLVSAKPQLYMKTQNMTDETY